jgi:hypothetical protein
MRGVLWRMMCLLWWWWWLCRPHCTNALWHTTFCLVTAYRPGEAYLLQVIASYMEQNIMQQDGVGLFVVDVDNSSGATNTGITHRNFLILPPILEMRQRFKTIQKVRLAPS